MNLDHAWLHTFRGDMQLRPLTPLEYMAATVLLCDAVVTADPVINAALDHLADLGLACFVDGDGDGDGFEMAYVASDNLKALLAAGLLHELKCAHDAD